MRIRTSTFSTAYDSVQRPNFEIGGDLDLIDEPALIKRLSGTDVIITPGGENLITRIFQDTVTPGWKKIVKENLPRPSNPRSTVEKDRICRYGCWGLALTPPLQKPYPPGIYSDMLMSGGGASGSMILQPKAVHSDRDVTLFSTEAMANAKSAGMDFLTSAAEFRQTIAMITSFKRNFQRRLVDAAKAFLKMCRSKRLFFKGLSEAWDAFSSFWLEFRFGWRILWYDIKAVEEFIQNRNEESKLFTRRVTSEKTSIENRQLFFRSRSRAGQTGSISHKLVLEYSETLRVGHTVDVDPAYLGNVNISNTIWDIIPFSLVVDWFFNVQEFLLAYQDSSINCRNLDLGFVSRLQTVTVGSETTITGASKGEMTLTGDLYATSYSRQYLRGDNFSVGLKPDISGYQFLDLAALIKPLTKVLISTIR